MTKTKPRRNAKPSPLESLDKSLALIAASDDEDTYLDWGMRYLRRWYYSEIRSLADAAIEAIVGRVVVGDPRRPSVLGHVVGIEIEPGADRREFLERWLDGELDCHAFVDIVYKTRAALLASDNQDAYAEDNGDDAVTHESTRCHAAMRADFWQLMDARRDEWERPEDDIDPEEEVNPNDAESDRRDRGLPFRDGTTGGR